MITYTAGKLLALQPTDVTITQTVKKSIFVFRLWHPRKQGAQCHCHEGVSSHDVLPRTDAADLGLGRFGFFKFNLIRFSISSIRFRFFLVFLHHY